MEEENDSLPDNTGSVLHEPQQDTLIGLQYINGEQDAVVWDKTEVKINNAHGADHLSLAPKTECSASEAEQCEPIIWPVRPMSFTCSPLSCATVQWDMPEPRAETPLLETDGGWANELDAGSVTTLGGISPSPHEPQDEHAELLTQGGKEEQGFDSQLLSSELEATGSDLETRDAADVQELNTEEKEDSAHELLDGNNDVPLTDSEEEDEGHFVASEPFKTEGVTDTAEEIQVSEEELDGVEQSDLEEEQEEPDVVLTGQRTPEEEGISAKCAEAEEESCEQGGEAEDEQDVTDESCSEESEEAKGDACLRDVEVPPEPPLTDDAGLLTIDPDKLTDLQQPEELEETLPSESEEEEEEEEVGVPEPLHEEPAGQTDGQEMCEDVDQDVDPDQLEAVDGSEEAPAQEAEHEARTENGQEIPEVIEQPDETNCLEQRDCDETASPPPETSEQLETEEKPEEIPAEVSQGLEEDQLGESQHLEQSPEMELTDQSHQPGNAEQPEEPAQTEQAVCAEAAAAERQEQTEPSEQNEQPLKTTDSSQPALAEQLVQSEKKNESDVTEQLSPETEITQQAEETEEAKEAEEAELNQVDKQVDAPERPEEVEGAEDGGVQTVVANGAQPKPLETAVPHMNGGGVDREKARHLAEQLFNLDGIQRADVVKHLDKDNDFSRAVGEEYLKFFDFTGQTLDQGLRSFLKVVILIGETQERERVLQHFSCRFHQCNPESFSSSGAVLALTCAVMLLNTDLHGQHVGKSMSSSKFVSNLDGMNEGGNFSKDLLKSLYNSIKSEALEWAVDEKVLKSAVLGEEDSGSDTLLRSKANPFQDVPHDKNATVVKQGFLQRKLHADIDGKRTPWGKRGWKTFYGMLKGMVLYLQKDNYRRDQQTSEEVVSVHHSLAEPATDYTKKPHVFRLQTADWRVFLFQASSKAEMNSWIGRINLVSALHSSPPFPAAIGSQRRFCRPILPVSQSAHNLERQLQSHARMLESFKADLTSLQENPPEGKRAKTKDLEEHRVRAEYLQHEMCRYESYILVLEAWMSVKKTDSDVLDTADLNLFDKAVCADCDGEEEEEEGALKKSHSSPSLELEVATPAVIKVRRNISERRTYRKAIIPRFNKEA